MLLYIHTYACLISKNEDSILRLIFLFFAISPFQTFKLALRSQTFKSRQASYFFIIINRVRYIRALIIRTIM